MSSTTFLWIVLFTTIILGGITLAIRNYRKQMRKPGENPPVQQEQEPQLTRQQQLLQVLEAQREENALKAWRITCTTRFWNLSRSIQEIAALDASKADICGRLQITLTNNSVKSLLALRDEKPEPIGISPAIREADVEKLEAIVRYERDQVPETLLDIPWEKLLKDTASCLNLLIQAVDEEKADVCRGVLAQLETVLKTYGIRAVYYDEAKSQVANPQEDYLVGSNWEIPVLYACDTQPWIRVGEMGAARS